MTKIFKEGDLVTFLPKSLGQRKTPNWTTFLVPLGEADIGLCLGPSEYFVGHSEVLVGKNVLYVMTGDLKRLTKKK